MLLDIPGKRYTLLDLLQTIKGYHLLVKKVFPIRPPYSQHTTPDIGFRFVEAISYRQFGVLLLVNSYTIRFHECAYQNRILDQPQTIV